MGIEIQTTNEASVVEGSARQLIKRKKGRKERGKNKKVTETKTKRTKG